MDDYLEQCRKLSLTARMAIALLSFEKFCDENDILSPLTTELSDYLWEWPLIASPDEFDPWEASRPLLANYGLGDSAPAELLTALYTAKIEEARFRSVVSGLIEILWVSFWGEAEDEKAMEALSDSLRGAKLNSYPPLTPFKFSLFSDQGGWGEQISRSDRDFWRECFQ